MKKTLHLLFFTLIAIAFTACQKDDMGGGGSETGDWNFLGMHVKIKQSEKRTEGNENAEMITYTEYDTENNSGTMSFDGANCTSTDIAYTASWVSPVEYYENGVLQDEFEYPFEIPMPAYSNVAPYTKEGDDKLKFAAGAVTTVSGTASTGAIVYQLGFDSDKMTMYYSGTSSSSSTVSGMTSVVTTDMEITVTLQQK